MVCRRNLDDACPIRTGRLNIGTFQLYCSSPDDWGPEGGVAGGAGGDSGEHDGRVRQRARGRFVCWAARIIRYVMWDLTGSKPKIAWTSRHSAGTGRTAGRPHVGCRPRGDNEACARTSCAFPFELSCDCSNPSIFFLNHHEQTSLPRQYVLLSVLSMFQANRAVQGSLRILVLRMSPSFSKATVASSIVVS